MNYFRILVLFFCIYCGISNGYAKDIMAVITDEKNKPIDGAVSVCIALPDSSYYGSSMTDPDGLITINVPDNKGWYLQISCLGYDTERIDEDSIGKLSTVSGPEGVSRYVIPLQGKALELDEVVVTSQKPSIVQKEGKFIYNNLKEIMNSRVVTSAHDLILNLPIVNSTNGDTPSIAGAPFGTVVFINGKPSQMTQQQLLDYLKNIPSEQVANVEIIYNPSPKWRTRSAVINVTLKDAKRWSVNGMGQVTDVEKHVNSINTGVSLTANFGKPTVNLMYSFNEGKSQNKYVELAKHSLKNDIYEITDTTDLKMSSPSHTVYTNFKFDFDSSNSLDVNYYGMFSPKNTSDQNNLNSYYGKYLTNNNSHSNLNSVMLVYNRASGVQVGVEYRNYNSRLKGEVFQEGPDNTKEAFAHESFQTVNSLSAYADMSNSLPKGWTIKYGGKFDFNKNNNHLDNILSSEGMAGESSNSVMKEYIGSAYAGASRYFFNNKLYADASLSMEYYKLEDFSEFNFLPKLSLTFIPSYSHIFQMSYTTYNSFPAYWQRQEFASYDNPYHLNLGNPYLKPARYHIGNLIYMLKSKYVLSASFYKVNNFYLSQTYLSPNSLVQISQMFNIDYSSLFDLTLTVPFDIKTTLFNTDCLRKSGEV